jgi:hypothetical protein
VLAVLCHGIHIVFDLIKKAGPRLAAGSVLFDLINLFMELAFGPGQKDQIKS